MKYLEPSAITRILQWILGVGFLVIGTAIFAGGGFNLGFSYLVLGAITVPLLKLPFGFRTAAILIGAFLL